MNIEDRSRGALVGLAVGDALGTTLEFKPPGSFEPIDDMVGGGPFNLDPGQWTDDTSMALCLAESLIECGGFDARDQMDRYLRWWQEGYLSSTGRCFDIGGTVMDALRRYRETGEPFSGATHERSAGNGCIMRLAPIPIAYAHDADAAIHHAGESSRTTHGTAACLDACRFMSGLMTAAIHGASKDKLLSEAWKGGDLHTDVHAIANGSYTSAPRDTVRGTGYVIDCLHAALWAFHESSTFEEGALLAVNLGDDADTTGAVYGQIAGAHYGLEQVPTKWVDRITMRDEIIAMADALTKLG